MIPDDERAVEGRAQELGLTLLEELALEQREPWVKHEASREGRGAWILRQWIAAGLPRAERDKLCVSGAPAAVKLVRALVDRVPEPAAWHICETTAISWVPGGLGLTGPWPAPPRRPETRIDMAFEVSERNLGLVAHELAHAFQRDPELFGGLSTAEIEELDEMIAAQPGASERDERADLVERAADALASVWLGVAVDTSRTRERSRRLATHAGSAQRGGDQ